MNINKKTKNKFLNLNSGAIHIENKVSLKERLTWLNLVWVAIPELKKKSLKELENTAYSFEIDLSEIKKLIGYKGNNNKRIKEILDQLVTTKVNWNIFNKDSHIWGGCTLLSYYEVISNENSAKCRFSFNPFIQSRLTYPEMYTKINLLISKEFKSKNTLAIYSIALDYLNLERNYSEKFFEINEFKEFLGLENDYKNNSDFYRWVIKQSEKEINSKSDMKIRIDVIKEDNNKKYSKIIGFKLSMSIKEKFLKYYKSKKHFDSSKLIDNKELQSINKIQIKDDKLNTFLQKYNVLFNNETIINKYKNIENELKEKTEDYLFWLIKKVENDIKNSKSKIQNPAGIFVNNIDLQTNITLFQQNQERLFQIKKEKETKEEQEKIDNLKIKYEQFVGEECKSFLEKDKNNLNKFYELVKKEQSNTNIGQETIVNSLIKKNKGYIDYKLLDYSAFRAFYLDKITEKFSFIPPSFEGWKKVFDKDVITGF